jgi:nitrous oxidase accessory protein
MFALSRSILLSLLALVLLAAQPAAAHEEGTALVVSPQGPYTTIEAALAAAEDGEVIEVRGGRYAGPLVVEKSVTLAGVGRPVVENNDSGTVVTLAVPGIVMRGFMVRGSGTQPDRDHAGITLTAANITVEDNVLEDVLFGIFVSQANDAVVRNNTITSKTEFETGRKGDAIRLWYSENVLVEGNHVYDARDVIVWYSAGVILRDNTIEGSRYGVHLMYCDGAQIENNRLLNNSVGVYTMYSDEVSLRENLIRGQRGPSGYALGFKDTDNVEIIGNVLVDNGAGAFLDGLPFTPEGYGRFEDNIFAYNDVGVILLPAVRGNDFAHNSFWENVEQVSVQGGGTLGENGWQGNYWSDYSGFDADGDGRGDLPYRAERFFEGLTDREPRLRMILYSPVAQAIEFAGQAFPLIRPQPKLVDESPLMEPVVIPAFAAGEVKQDSTGGMVAAAGLLFGFVVTLSIAGVRRLKPALRTEEWLKPARRTDTQYAIRNTGEPMTTNIQQPITISVQQVSKRYGQVEALRGVSFTAAAGQAIALWGQNGAGKSTLLKAILGLIEFEGEIEIEGHSTGRQGKLARRSVGYVPQEAVFYDWRVQATMEFYARLKKVGPPRQSQERIGFLLARLGLTEHRQKAVTALSGGLKQRLALAIALLADPPVLLLDEPTANLDAAGRRDYLRLLAGLRAEGKTILFATHRLEELESLADQVLLLEQGQLVERVAPETLRSRLAPAVELTLWVPERQRTTALDLFQGQGWPAHLNGRGSVVVSVAAAGKMEPFAALKEQGIPVLDFEVS